MRRDATQLWAPIFGPSRSPCVAIVVVDEHADSNRTRSVASDFSWLHQSSLNTTTTSSVMTIRSRPAPQRPASAGRFLLRDRAAIASGIAVADYRMDIPADGRMRR